MTTSPAPICLGCTHFHPTGTPLTCDAFPEGIPATILQNRADHRQSYPDDHGIVFAPKDAAAADYAARVFPSASPTHDDAPDYPAEVLRYGDPGKALYDGQVVALVGIDVPPDEARHDVLSMWPTLVKGKSLQPISD